MLGPHPTFLARLDGSLRTLLAASGTAAATGDAATAAARADLDDIAGTMRHDAAAGAERWGQRQRVQLRSAADELTRIAGASDDASSVDGVRELLDAREPQAWIGAMLLDARASTTIDAAAHVQLDTRAIAGLGSGGEVVADAVDLRRQVAAVELLGPVRTDGRVGKLGDERKWSPHLDPHYDVSVADLRDELTAVAKGDAAVPVRATVDRGSTTAANGRALLAAYDAEVARLTGGAGEAPAGGDDVDRLAHAAARAMAGSEAGEAAFLRMAAGDGGFDPADPSWLQVVHGVSGAADELVASPAFDAVRAHAPWSMEHLPATLDDLHAAAAAADAGAPLDPRMAFGVRHEATVALNGVLDLRAGVLPVVQRIEADLTATLAAPTDDLAAITASSISALQHLDTPEARASSVLRRRDLSRMAGDALARLDEAANLGAALPEADRARIADLVASLDRPRAPYDGPDFARRVAEAASDEAVSTQDFQVGDYAGRVVRDLLEPDRATFAQRIARIDAIVDLPPGQRHAHVERELVAALELPPVSARRDQVRFALARISAHVAGELAAALPAPDPQVVRERRFASLVRLDSPVPFSMSAARGFDPLSTVALGGSPAEAAARVLGDGPTDEAAKLVGKDDPLIDALRRVRADATDLGAEADPAARIRARLTAIATRLDHDGHAHDTTFLDGHAGDLQALHDDIAAIDPQLLSDVAPHLQQHVRAELARAVLGSTQHAAGSIVDEAYWPDRGNLGRIAADARVLATLHDLHAAAAQAV